MLSRRLQYRMLMGLAFGLLVLAALVLFADSDSLIESMRAFDWRITPLVLALVIGNYVLRFMKWEWYLRRVEVRDLSLRDSILIFVSGFSMAMTPGKVGEFLKAYLVRVRTETPMARTLPVVLAERLTDGTAMLVLAAIGVAAFQYGWPLLLFMTIVIGLLFLVIQRETLVIGMLRKLRSVRLVGDRVQELEAMYHATRSLLRPRPLALMVGLSTISWFLECIALLLILVGLGIPFTPWLILASTFVFATSAWLGGASLLPGGLGATEASATALLLLTVNEPEMTRGVAASATLLLRVATLWFGVAIGIATLFVTARWASAKIGESSVETDQVLDISRQ